MRLQARQHDIGPKTCHRHRRLAGLQQPLVQPLQRGLAEYQQRVAVAELVRRLQAAGPLQAGKPPVRRVKTHQPAGPDRRPRITRMRLRQKIRDPLARQRTQVIGRHQVVPNPYCQRLLDPVNGDVQRQHAGGAQHQMVGFELRLNQRQPGHFALGDKFALSVHHHPGPVQIKPGVGQQRLGHCDPGAGFDRVDQQLLNAGRQGAARSLGVVQWMTSMR